MPYSRHTQIWLALLSHSGFALPLEIRKKTFVCLRGLLDALSSISIVLAAEEAARCIIRHHQSALFQLGWVGGYPDFARRTQILLALLCHSNYALPLRIRKKNMSTLGYRL